MTKREKAVMLAVIAALVLAAAPLAAQESNTSRVTQGIFGTEVDDFLDYHNYGEVKFDKWFGMAGASSDSVLAGKGFALGYSRYLGGLYLGLGYEGNPFSSLYNKTTGSDVTYDPSGNPTQKITNDTISADHSAVGLNDIRALLGFGSIGIGLGFSENLSFTGSPETSPTSTVTETLGLTQIQYYNKLESFSEVSGFLRPSFGFGVTLGKLKPFAEIAVEFNQDAREYKHSNYTTVNGTVTGGKTTYLEGKNGDYITPMAVLGLNLALREEGPVSVEAEITYGIGVSLYSNQYEAFGKSGTVNGTYEYTYSGNTRVVNEASNSTTVTDSASIDLVEKSGMFHSLQPSLKYTNKVSDQFRAGFSLALPVSLSIRSQEAWNETSTITTYTQTNDSTQNYVREVNDIGIRSKNEYTGLWVNPVISAGAVYDLVPEKFAVTSGISVAVPVTYSLSRATPDSGFGSHSVTERDYQGNDIITPQYGPSSPVGSSYSKVDSVTQLLDCGAPETTVSLGFTLFFGPKASLDTAFAIGTDTGFNVDLTKLSVLFTLKN